MGYDPLTLAWVLSRIRGYQNDEFYEYCSSLESLESDVQFELERGSDEQ